MLFPQPEFPFSQSPIRIFFVKLSSTDSKHSKLENKGLAVTYFQRANDTVVMYGFKVLPSFEGIYEIVTEEIL